MAKKFWNIQVEKNEHSVQFHTGGFRSMPTIPVDGKPLETSAVSKTDAFQCFLNSQPISTTESSWYG